MLFDNPRAGGDLFFLAKVSGKSVGQLSRLRENDMVYYSIA